MADVETFLSADDAFVQLLSDVRNYGHHVSPRGMAGLELRNVALRIEYPRNRLVTTRDIRRNYTAASVAWNLGMRNDVESICWWNENGRRISDDGEIFHGADYGRRILTPSGSDKRSPLREAMALLQHDGDTRRAWVPIHNWWTDGGEYSENGKDVPCTIGFWLTTFDGHLEMYTVMRSQSVWGVFPYDVFLFTVLQELIANELDLALGVYEHNMLSCHIYDRELDVIDATLSGEPVGSAPMPPLPYGLDVAMRELPRCMDELAAGGDVGEWEADPLVQLMLEHRPQVVN